MIKAIKNLHFLTLSPPDTSLPSVPSPKGSSCLCTPRAIEPHCSEEIEFDWKITAAKCGRCSLVQAAASLSQRVARAMGTVEG